jgi:hypothetical protein
MQFTEIPKARPIKNLKGEVSRFYSCVQESSVKEKRFKDNSNRAYYLGKFVFEDLKTS